MPLAAARCGACIAHPPYFDASVTAADYRPPLDQLAQGLKFGARLALAALFAELLRDALLAAREHHQLAMPDMLLAVPLGPARLRERGFNQAQEIARALAHQIGLPLESELVTRARETPRQTGLKDAQRQSNLSQAFKLSPHASVILHGRHVGIVDDVMTTGATLNSLARELKAGGATRVTCLAALRTPAPQTPSS